MSFRIEHRVGVPAPAPVIWQVLSDLPGWSAWNPIYPKVAGELRIGAKLEVHETIGGRPAKVIAPTVVDWVPDAQILWTLSEAGGLIRRVRYIEIDTFEETSGGCILANGELWQGLVGERVGKRRRHALRAGFEAFNHALAERVAQLVAARGPL
ncbi:MAG TPA: SRPBCC domain-containing protein [Caulobacteraceae bacterium]|nr:SRPBCC domain-containing protein [Caulobacteraceae bacterium]